MWHVRVVGNVRHGYNQSQLLVGVKCKERQLLLQHRCNNFAMKCLWRRRTNRIKENKDSWPIPKRNKTTKANKTKQNNQSKQNKTKQPKQTKQNKTKQNKTNNKQQGNGNNPTWANQHGFPARDLGSSNRLSRQWCRPNRTTFYMHWTQETGRLMGKPGRYSLLPMISLAVKPPPISGNAPGNIPSAVPFANSVHQCCS